MNFTPQKIEGGVDLTPFFDAIEEKLPTLAHIEQVMLALFVRDKLQSFKQAGKADIHEFIDCLGMLHCCGAAPKGWDNLFDERTYITCRLFALEAAGATENGGEQ
jgi:hypothetical protein